MTHYTSMLTEDEFLEHFGKKGMKWGVRKEDVVYTRKLKGGGSLSVTKLPPHPISRALSAISKTHKEGADKLSFFTLKNEKGKKVGDATFYQDTPDSLNLMWIGVKGAHRGNGYASAALKGVVNYAQDKGLKKLTLEVPGNAPDALHIYSNLGFKVTGKVSSDNDIWGGLTSMELAVPQKTLTHSGLDLNEVIDYITRELDLIMPEEDSSLTQTGILTQDEFLEHFGKKGMKWGVRKAPDISGATMAIKPKRTDAEKAALRKKILIGAAATAAALAVVGSIAYVKYDAKTLLRLQSMVANNVSTMSNDISQNPTGDQLLRRGAEFTRRSYGKNSAWANPLRTYVIEGPETDFIKGYGDTVFKFSAARDIKIAGLNTQYDILKGPISGKALRNVSAEQYAKYSLSGRKYINKTLSDDTFAKLTLGELRKSAWDSSEDGSRVAAKYADLLKTRGYSAVNDLNFPKSSAKVLLDPSAFARA